MVARVFGLWVEVQDTKKSHRVKGHGGSSGVAGMACSWLACGVRLSQSVLASKPIRDKKWALGPLTQANEQRDAGAILRAYQLYFGDFTQHLLTANHTGRLVCSRSTSSCHCHLYMRRNSLTSRFALLLCDVHMHFLASGFGRKDGPPVPVMPTPLFSLLTAILPSLTSPLTQSRTS